ncbi:2-trimethylaminoethylphosphonate dioxygenase [Streptacidiphilus fuscans]|uniref:TauD/TfdA family dioxygenase n=1 Tax=Streptacidiphilus fuscans TaxID=2789292 RepID=A0A931B6K9_9ACTN|nr:TauD/TfdA family dioxygenase [Streptacidiphilus fuscans]MBF9071188.1 TauD/TfdA family dioxygenase [Streptacidiphilus fuscans]
MTATETAAETAAAGTGRTRTPRPTALSAVWLRDNCGCAECRDPGTGQKLFQITDLPDSLAIASAEQRTEAGRDGSGSGDGSDSSEGWDVVWSPDGHRSHYDAAWLAAAAQPDPRAEDGKELWPFAEDLDGRLPETSWDAYRSDDRERLRMLDAVRSLGFCLLRGVPLEDGQVQQVALSFGFVRETNYGLQFEVRVEEQPNNLAFTNVAITPHTDNPYRDPVPTLQLLHCLVNDALGGDSGLVDGFAVAARLREQDPEAFAVLTTTPVEFAFRDAVTELSAHRPLIDVDAEGRIREVRFNNRSLGTLRLPAARTDAFYRAYRAFAELLLAPEAQLEFRLGPGDCLIFDNTRLLHARTAFERGGARHLQGCYADLDALLSTVAVLRRTHEEQN